MATEPLETAPARPDVSGGDMNARCPRCGAALRCGSLAGEPDCWCARLPVLDPLPADLRGCLCPDCLRALLPRG